MIRSMEEFVSAFRAARCVSTPLVTVRTADPASTTNLLADTFRQGHQTPPLLGWDVIRDLFGIGKDVAEELARGSGPTDGRRCDFGGAETPPFRQTQGMVRSRG
jgi:hypothetical protein